MHHEYNDPAMSLVYTYKISYYWNGENHTAVARAHNPLEAMKLVLLALEAKGRCRVQSMSVDIIMDHETGVVAI